ncbi:MAG: YggT family protein [Treponema sp.]|jgi:YggT family protein|nr:YggT family protein [Treponema sp.]
MSFLMNILAAVTGIYMFLIFIRVILTWFSGVSYGRPIEILTGLTDPYLNWFRRFSFLRTGFLDLSPIAAMMVLSVVNNIFFTLSRYGTITLGLILAMLLSALWSALSFILGFFIIVLGLRLFAFLTNRNIYGSFWKVVDTISQPVLYRINRIIFRRRLVKYLTGLLSSLAALLVLMLVLRFAVAWVTLLLTRLPL